MHLTIPRGIDRFYHIQIPLTKADHQMTENTQVFPGGFTAFDLLYIHVPISFYSNGE